MTRSSALPPPRVSEPLVGTERALPRSDTQRREGRLVGAPSRKRRTGREAAFWKAARSRCNRLADGLAVTRSSRTCGGTALRRCGSKLEVSERGNRHQKRSGRGQSRRGLELCPCHCPCPGGRNRSREQWVMRLQPRMKVCVRWRRPILVRMRATANLGVKGIVVENRPGTRQKRQTTITCPVAKGFRSSIWPVGTPRSRHRSAAARKQRSGA